MRPMWLLFLVCLSNGCGGQDLTGTVGDTLYHIQVPRNWNGTLLIFSHGYIAQTSPGLEQKFLRAGLGPDPDTVTWLADNGYALAATLYGQQGWAVATAITDQLALLDLFEQKIGAPKHVVAWGASMGGLITVALAELHPDRINGAMPMCGSMSGGVEVWNTGLDAAYAFVTLAAPDAGIELAHVSNPAADASMLSSAIASAGASPAGRARLTLAAALADAPSWPEGAVQPAPNDYTTHSQAEIATLQKAVSIITYGRVDLETKVGGNPSSNAGVDYGQLLMHSIDSADVTAAYSDAGLSLAADLAALAAAPRINTDPTALAALMTSYSPTGKLQVPMLTLHTIADDEAPDANEGTYLAKVMASGNGAQLRQAFVRRQGHCNFLPAEIIASLKTLLQKITMDWPDAGATALNASAGTIGGLPTAGAPAFIAYAAPRLPRDFE